MAGAWLGGPEGYGRGSWLNQSTRGVRGGNDGPMTGQLGGIRGSEGLEGVKWLKIGVDFVGELGYTKESNREREGR